MNPFEPALRILVICSGNTCRSPLVAAALAAELGEDARRIEIASAGTSTSGGHPASDGALLVAESAGLDLSAHRSRRASPALLRAADFVFVMEPMHVVALVAVGADRGRIHVLSEWPEPGEPELPVSDPFGASQEAYEECWRRIRLHIRRIAPAVRQALQARNAS
jgi:protein-tyrosine phosphatase